MLKRLGATPLGRPRLLARQDARHRWRSRPCRSRCCGRSPSPSAGTRRRSRRSSLAVVLGTVAFAGLGLCLAGSLKALVTLAAANGLYLVLLLVSGHGHPARRAARPGCGPSPALLPSGALAEVVRGTLTRRRRPGPGLGRAGRCGPSPPRSPPPACSAGSEGDRRDRGAWVEALAGLITDVDSRRIRVEAMFKIQKLDIEVLRQPSTAPGG